MARVTSKLQVSIPKRIADECGIAPGDEIEFVLSGGNIRVVRAGKRAAPPTAGERLELFDRATARQKARQRSAPRPDERGTAGRGWTRDALYDRGRAR
jgi:AbrB family looped-hinge helix DNA binding protein